MKTKSPPSGGKLLENAHQCGAGAMGRLSLMLATKKLSRGELEQVMHDLRETARQIEFVISQHK